MEEDQAHEAEKHAPGVSWWSSDAPDSAWRFCASTVWEAILILTTAVIVETRGSKRARNEGEFQARLYLKARLIERDEMH